MIKTTNPYTLEQKAYEEHSDASLDAIFRDVSKKHQSHRQSKLSERLKKLKKLEKQLHENLEACAQIMSEEMGKPIRQSRAEIEKCEALCDVYLQHSKKWLKDKIIKTPDGKNIISYESRGLVLIIMPWNYPFWQVFRAAIPALVAGNTVVLKHASAVTGSALLLEEIIAGSFGKNSFRTILVPGSKTDALIEKQKIAKINFTGSTEVGKIIASKAGSALIECVLELGGNDAYLVLPDADLEKAAEILIHGRMLNNGQSCIAAKRWIVHKKVHSDFLGMVSQKLESLVIGNPMLETTDIGPLVNESALKSVHEILDRLEKEGNRLIVHSAVLPDIGYFCSPTLVEVKDANRAYNDLEIFGPIALVYKAGDIEEMLSLANDSKYGLASGVLGGKSKKSLQIARRLEAGGAAVNAFYASHPMLPFGGFHESGYGRELGELGLHSFCNIKTIQLRE